MDDKKDVLEGVSPAQTSAVTDSEYTVLVEQTQQINVKLDTLCDISIVLLVGLGIVAGILCNHVFSRYFRG